MAVLLRHRSRTIVCFFFPLILGLSFLYISSYSHHDIRDDIHHVYRDIQQVYGDVPQVCRMIRFRQKQAFINVAAQTTIDGPFDNRETRDLCASKNWTEGLISLCMAPQGGIGNVRNVFLNCVRYAIEAGGKCPMADTDDLYRQRI
jgi:hypothetical protein